MLFSFTRCASLIKPFLCIVPFASISSSPNLFFENNRFATSAPWADGRARSNFQTPFCPPLLLLFGLPSSAGLPPPPPIVCLGCIALQPYQYLHYSSYTVPKLAIPKHHIVTTQHATRNTHHTHTHHTPIQHTPYITLHTSHTSSKHRRSLPINLPPSYSAPNYQTTCSTCLLCSDLVTLLTQYSTLVLGLFLPWLRGTAASSPTPLSRSLVHLFLQLISSSLVRILSFRFFTLLLFSRCLRFFRLRLLFFYPLRSAFRFFQTNALLFAMNSSADPTASYLT
ncbi:hypothetical protein BB8028_0001g04720 [Beauveria bassiana]|uniref:Uncharacterized protein n=1 Tax=Beauveria bassiana TaxID=176275 RepID=A0A2S7XWV4_BEABA|nr:hypothetical protein BB8028_0001g04720 [Beauveria bassiana]